ncbi:protease pro-enzyme activation domain-containing protein, partial [Streptomyces sp. NPDC006668]|uniref:protease pro-enzyme activation domain-containing protein n=1 Tax=Streptomyces sp. NPDC006668 TaxID=3156903 RepID=UPI0033F817AC
MRSNRAVLRAVNMAATLPMITGALALGIPAAHAADAPARDTLAGTKPAWATAKADKGAASNSAQVHARVYFAGRNADGLTAYAKAVSDPSSSAYGKYLSVKQAQTRFGATRAQMAAVTSWLTAAGLKVTGTTEHYVSVSGDVAAAEKAFGTQLHNFAKGSKTYRAPAKAATVPDSLKGAVLTVTGLDNAPHQTSHDDQLPGPGPVFKNSGPFSSYYGSNIASTLPDAYGTKIP